MRRTFIIIIAIAIVVVLWLVSSYNGLISAKAAVESNWSQVETQYQRRLDLIPNLVSTVKGAAKFENDTFREVTEARSGWAQATQAGDRTAQIAAASTFDSALSRLIVTVEAYPQLQATQAFRDLMVDLSGTENRIATARRDFNLSVQNYNVRVTRFPGLLSAAIFGFSPQPYFESADAAKEAPSVSF